MANPPRVRLRDVTAAAAAYQARVGLYGEREQGALNALTRWYDLRAAYEKQTGKKLYVPNPPKRKGRRTTGKVRRNPVRPADRERGELSESLALENMGAYLHARKRAAKDRQELAEIGALLGQLQQLGRQVSKGLHTNPPALAEIQQEARAAQAELRRLPDSAGVRRAYARLVAIVTLASGKSAGLINPPLLIVGNPPLKMTARIPRGAAEDSAPLHFDGMIGSRVIEVRYQHAEDGNLYKHKFDAPAQLYAVTRNGARSLFIASRRSLWNDFD